MISISARVDDGGTRSFLVEVAGTLESRRELNEVLADRLAYELREHFARKNRLPNKMGAPKSNFWNKVAEDTNVEEVTDTGASVAVAEVRFRIHLFGGTILPKKAKALTVPLIKEARGESVASYRLKTGHRLFTIPGRNVLFEKADNLGATESRVGFTRGRDRGFGVKLAARQGLRAVFALKASVTIEADPDALPPLDDLVMALQEKADDFIEGALAKGGAA